MTWKNTKDKLPPLDKLVLLVIRTDCECDHYAQIVGIRRQIADDGAYVYDSGITHPEVGGETIAINPNTVKFWQNVPALPHGLEAGY